LDVGKEMRYNEDCQEAAEPSQELSQDAPELSGCRRTVRMQQNYQDAAELQGPRRIHCSVYSTVEPLMLARR
jgi:hypothetical protein